MATPAAAGLPLDGRNAVVTGASRGIGRAIAVHLHSLGANLVLNYASNSAQANILASELNQSSTPRQRVIAVQADVSDPAQVKRLFDSAVEELGSEIHIVVNAAGILDSKYPSLAGTALEDWDETFRVNCRGAFLVCKEAANRLKRGGGGRIILITTSIVGSLPPGYGAYAASKAAVEAMAKTAAKELKGTEITVNCVAPGPVATELFFAGKSEEMVARSVDACPLGRLGQPDDVAKVVGFLATDGGGWVNGQVVRVNGGLVI
ncbi:NADPH-dependent aldehyde reductase-like protein, chloroplastic [Cucurbita moschata]|uniref:NADPH-dependent aldehyde reductase-like protein, chloroplastic n=1 Tax=Cucurbita moschata TaxID=3662 RepID=A0A6J1EGB3_CUCMO|nr:NADPH-dependent aldehyde reductase-like protein, chloroplastic [Cucurbita moschata]